MILGIRSKNINLCIQGLYSKFESKAAREAKKAVLDNQGKRKQEIHKMFPWMGSLENYPYLTIINN